MVGIDEDSAMQADTYIDALLAAHARQPVGLPRGSTAIPPGVRETIAALERLPRFHPSFLFEKQLADQLLMAGADGADGGQLVPLPSASLTPVSAAWPRAAAERRLIVGGAIASGVSIAGLAGAYVAWRRRHRHFAA